MFDWLTQVFELYNSLNIYIGIALLFNNWTCNMYEVRTALTHSVYFAWSAMHQWSGACDGKVSHVCWIYQPRKCAGGILSGGTIAVYVRITLYLFIAITLSLYYTYTTTLLQSHYYFITITYYFIEITLLL